MISAQQESLCNDEYCSHIYYDLDGRQHALCALGERMTETDVYRTVEDSAVYEAMYFASIPNLMRQVRSAERQRLRNCM